MGALKLTYRPEKNTLNLRIAYKSDSVNQREPSTKDGSNLRLHYYVFGMQMPGIGYRNADGYLFGFNGQEQTPELDPSHTTALFWEYDARLGRRWNTDPITYPWQSPYACFNNSPLYFVDPFGLEGEDPKKGDTFVGDDGKTYTCNVGAATCTAKAPENTSVNEITETITNDLKEVAVSDNTQTKPYQYEWSNQDNLAVYDFSQSNTEDIGFSYDNKFKPQTHYSFIKQGKSEFQRYWENTSSQMVRQWIETDPVINSVAISGAVVTTVAALPTLSATINGAKKAYDGGQLLYMTIQGSEGAIGFGTGVGIGTVEYFSNAPANMPASNNPFIEVPRQATNVAWQIFENGTSKLNKKDNNSQEIEYEN